MKVSKEIPPFPAGVYGFEVFRAEETVSKAARDAGRTDPDMLKLVLKADAKGHDGYVFAYIKANQTRRINALMACLGLPEDPNEIVCDDLTGRQGKARFGIEESAEFGAKNIVSDWLPAEKSAGKPAPKSSAPDMTAMRKQVRANDDDIPF